ncbi:MAG: hypothetical protein RLZZ221_1851, partial [Verrucomicrobiota bacterium]
MKIPPALFVLLTALAPLAAAPSYDQSGVALEVDAPRPGLAKIVILAGAQPGVWPVMARGWPKDERVLEGARSIVYYGDGGGKQPFAEPKRWATLVRLMAGGTGLVLLHQAMDFPLGADGAAVKGWLGAVFHSDIGSRG